MYVIIVDSVSGDPKAIKKAVRDVMEDILRGKSGHGEYRVFVNSALDDMKRETERYFTEWYLSEHPKDTAFERHRREVS